jgi:hypothetical protein
MTEFFRTRSQSLSMVVFVLLIIVFFQGSISYSTTFGAAQPLHSGYGG